MMRDISLLLIIGLALIMVLTLDFHEKENFYIEDEVIKDPNLYYKDYTPNPSDLIISRSDYANKLYGFWLGQCIANWTGLVTEMDKIGNSVFLFGMLLMNYFRMLAWLYQNCIQQMEKSDGMLTRKMLILN